MSYVLICVTAFAVSGILYGLNVLLQKLAAKEKCYRAMPFCMQIVSFPFAVAVCIIFDRIPFDFKSLISWQMWLTAIATVVISSLVVLVAGRKRTSDETIALRCFEAATMEIVQRVFMQTFIYGLLRFNGLKVFMAIPLNAIVFCADIAVEAIICRDKNLKKIAYEMLSSMLFSLGIGFVYFISNCFVIPMLAHAAERFVTASIENRRNN